MVKIKHSRKRHSVLELENYVTRSFSQFHYLLELQWTLPQNAASA